MIGKQQLVIGAKDILEGLASSDYSGNGGLGISSANINPFVTEGILQATQDPTDKSSNLSGNLIASCEDSQVVAPANRVLIDAAGNVYDSSSSGGLTKRITGAAKVYSFGVTDMESYAGSSYATSTTHIAQINTSAWTWTEAFKAFNDASAHHPLLVFEQLLYAGDGNLLKTLDAGGTFSTILTLASTEKIVALGIDPGTGQMLISTQISYNPTDSVQQRGIIYLYDGNSTKPTRKIIVEDIVTAFRPHGGIVHIGMGQLWGYWTGTGVGFLRKMRNVTLTQNSLLYKHRFASIGRVLFGLDGTQVLAYAEMVPGRKRFWPFTTASGNTSPFVQMLCPIGGNLLGIGSSTNTFAVVDITSANGGSGNAYSPVLQFPRPVFVSRVRFITTGITNAGGGAIDRGSLTLFDEKLASHQTTGATFSTPAVSTKYVYDFDFGRLLLQSLQAWINFGGFNTSNSLRIVQMIIYYDAAE